MATTNLMGDQEHDHAARLAHFAVEAVTSASVSAFTPSSLADSRQKLDPVSTFDGDSAILHTPGTIWTSRFTRMQNTSCADARENTHMQAHAHKFTHTHTQEVMIDEDEPSKGHVSIRAGFHSGPVGA